MFDLMKKIIKREQRTRINLRVCILHYEHVTKLSAVTAVCYCYNC